MLLCFSLSFLISYFQLLLFQNSTANKSDRNNHKNHQEHEEHKNRRLEKTDLILIFEIEKLRWMEIRRQDDSTQKLISVSSWERVLTFRQICTGLGVTDGWTLLYRAGTQLRETPVTVPVPVEIVTLVRAIFETFDAT